MGSKAGTPLNFHSPAAGPSPPTVRMASRKGARTEKARWMRGSTPLCSPGCASERPISGPRGTPSTHAISPDGPHSQRNKGAELSIARRARGAVVTARAEAAGAGSGRTKCRSCRRLSIRARTSLIEGIGKAGGGAGAVDAGAGWRRGSTVSGSACTGEATGCSMGRCSTAGGGDGGTGTGARSGMSGCSDRMNRRLSALARSMTCCHW